MPLEELLAKAASWIGIDAKRIGDVDIHEQKYAKILPVSDNERKRFMIWATEQFNIFSLGRFATWRPGLLLDDLVNDIRIIHRLAKGETAYDAKKEAT